MMLEKNVPLMISFTQGGIPDMMLQTFKKIVLSSAIISSLLCLSTEALTPNPLLSRSKPTFGYPAGSQFLVNGIFQGSGWNVGANTWVAINLGTAGPTKIFVTWNNPAYTWEDNVSTSIYCTKQNPLFPINYEILMSNNSTNGTDGTWTTAVTITNNTATARGHLISNFTGMSWVKLHVTTGGGQLDEIEVFDASNGTEDTWFFAGTSISANAF
jgi:acyl-CoA thioesterase I